MSLLLIQTPNYLEYAYNPFYFQMTGTNTSYLNYKLIADVYCTDNLHGTFNVNDVSAGRFRIPIRLDQSIIFSPFRILESYVASSLTPTVTGITESLSSALRYRIDWGEEYDTSLSQSASTGNTIYANQFSTYGFILNANKQYDEPHTLVSYDFAKWLTNWDTTLTGSSVYKSIYEDEYETASLFVSAGNLLDRIIINTYNVSGTNIGNYAVSANSISLGYRYTVGTGTKNLNFSFYNNISLTSDTIINSNVETYDITGYYGIYQLSNTLKYQINRNTTKYQLTRFAFKNDLGDFDYFTFSLKFQKVIDIKRNEWQKFYSFFPTYGDGDRGRTISNIEGNKRFTVTSDWVNDAESLFLEYLFSSQEMFLLDSSGNKLPIILKTNPIEPKISDNDRLFNYTLDFEYAFDYNKQRS